MGKTESLSRPAILVVDDDPSVLAMLTAVLESEGHAVATANSAAEAKRKLRENKFALVITDMRMETETSGYEVVQAARALPDAPSVIILTAYGMAERQWREAGADAGLVKPVPIVELTTTIQQLLARRAA